MRPSCRRARLRGGAVDLELFLFLNGHILVFSGIEDLATVLTFDELGIFLAGNDLDDGMFAGRGHRKDVGGDCYGFCPPPRVLSTLFHALLVNLLG